MSTPLFILYNIANSPRGRLIDRGCGPCNDEGGEQEPLNGAIIDSDSSLLVDSDGTFLIDA